MADVGGERMPKVNVQQDSSHLNQAQLDYMRRIEQRNLERVRDLQKLRKRNILTGLLLAGGVFGIYFYSMHAVKQEKFLDDFDEPIKQ